MQNKIELSIIQIDVERKIVHEVYKIFPSSDELYGYSRSSLEVYIQCEIWVGPQNRFGRHLTTWNLVGKRWTRYDGNPCYSERDRRWKPSLKWAYFESRFPIVSRFKEAVNNAK